METAVFLVCAVICLAGAAGVVISRNPVHSALSLVATLFGIAVLFLNLDAQLLAAVQVIVYTGAIVVLILFVLMLLGVDREEDVESEPLVGQRQLAVVAATVIIGAVLAVLILGGSDVVTGQPRRTGDQASLAAAESNIEQIGLELFTTWVFPLEITAGLLTIAVVGAVLLSRRARDVESIPEPESLTDAGDERLTVPPARHGDEHDADVDADADADDDGAGA
jgi:NADH-quinone oxidoreductase subunit J